MTKVPLFNSTPPRTTAVVSGGVCVFAIVT